VARYGYIRLDSEDPDTARQADLLDSIGGFDKIFVDNKGQHEYKQLKILLSKIVSEDVLYVASADRICEKIEEFIRLVNFLKGRNAHLCCLDINFDTRSSASQLALRTLEVLNENEKRSMSRRKKEGIARAKKKGRRVGRPPVSIPPGFRDICKSWEAGEITGVEAIRLSGLKSTSFYKKAQILGFKRKKDK